VIDLAERQAEAAVVLQVLPHGDLFDPVGAPSSVLKG